MARAGAHPAQGTPQSRSSGATGAPGAWASEKLLLAVAVTGWHPCCLPGQLASLGQCGSLPLEESPSSRHSSSSRRRSGSSRPGDLVPPGPSGEPLPLGTTSRGHHRVGRALGEAHPTPGEPTEAQSPWHPHKSAAGMGLGWCGGEGGGWSGEQGWGRLLTQLSQGPVFSLPAAPVIHASLERDRAPCDDSPMAGGRSPGA